MKKEMEISVDNGKYTFIKYEGDYKVVVLRYNEEWLTIDAGCNAVVALMYQYEEVMKNRYNEGYRDGQDFERDNNDWNDTNNIEQHK